MRDSAAICPPTSCDPPDGAIAASPQFVVEAVNTSIAVYASNGSRQTGWPKDAQDFLGIADPSPSGCDAGLGPFLFDPRAFYDPNDARFWVSMDEVEGVSFANPSCDFSSSLWVAVSATSDPRGVWNVFQLDLSLGTGLWGDFPGLGFNAEAVFFSANMFDSNGTFQYAEIGEGNKAQMEANGSFTPYYFTDLSAGGITVDTVQPVETEVQGGGTGAGLFINSFTSGDPFGSPDCYSYYCHGVAVWAFTDPIGHDNGGPDPTLTVAVTSTKRYTIPPRASQPRCRRCIDAGDTRLSSTPVYDGHLIWAALTTGVATSGHLIPGLLWFGIDPSSPAVVQSHYFFYSYSSSLQAYYPAVMVNAGGRLTMVFDVSGRYYYSGCVYATKTAFRTDFPDGGRWLQQGLTNTRDRRWGDYTATSYSGFVANGTWILGQFVPRRDDWATRIGQA